MDDKKLIGGLYEKYEDYLTSEEWNQKKEIIKQIKGEYCNNCRSKKNLTVHHRTYIRVCNEKLADLIIVCKKCHDEIHANPKHPDNPSVVDKKEYDYWD